MLKLDRELQRSLLEKLSDAYPDPIGFGRLCDEETKGAAKVNLAYLAEHGLVSNVWTNETGPNQIHTATITAAGLDFLADDGGLTAILGVVTIRLHEESIRALLLAKAEKVSDVTIRAQLVRKIKELPASALQAATMDGLKQGLEHIDDLAAWLGTLLGS